MKTLYQVQSKFLDGEWLDDHMPFDNLDDAENYINSQPKRNYKYRISAEEIFETDSEELDFHDAWDAIGGDWQG